jgi:AraC-like DNA-binding protein
VPVTASIAELFMSEISESGAARQFVRPLNGKVGVPAEIAKLDEASLHRRSRRLSEQQQRGSHPSHSQFEGDQDGIREHLLVTLSSGERESLNRLFDIVSQAGFKLLLCDGNGDAFTLDARSQIAQQAVGGLSPRALRHVREYIDAHLSEDIGVQVLASLTGLSSCYFARAFKQSARATPHHYLMERRLEYSKKLLIETDLPLAQIALESGFSDQSHFSRRFRLFFGITPRSFRWASR